MTRYSLSIISTLSFFIVMGVMPLGSLQAGELTVDEYCELSIARLQLAEDIWRQEGRGPSAADEEMLLQIYGSTSAGYYRFAGVHRKELKAYLGANPQIREEIETIGARLDALIQQGESQ